MTRPAELGDNTQALILGKRCGALSRLFFYAFYTLVERKMLKNAMICGLVALAALAGCQTYPQLNPAETPHARDLDDAFNRVPVLVEGIRYHCAKLPLLEHAVQRRRAFRDIGMDADVVAMLVRPVPGLTDMPGSVGARIESLTNSVLQSVSEIKAAAEARDAQRASALADRMDAQTGELFAYVRQVTPVVSRGTRR